MKYMLTTFLIYSGGAFFITPYGQARFLYSVCLKKWKEKMTFFMYLLINWIISTVIQTHTCIAKVNFKGKLILACPCKRLNVEYENENTFCVWCGVAYGTYRDDAYQEFKSCVRVIGADLPQETKLNIFSWLIVQSMLKCAKHGALFAYLAEHLSFLAEKIYVILKFICYLCVCQLTLCQVNPVLTSTQEITICIQMRISPTSKSLSKSKL